MHASWWRNQMFSLTSSLSGRAAKGKAFLFVLKKPVVKISFQWYSLEQKCKAMGNMCSSSFLYTKFITKLTTCISVPSLNTIQLNYNPNDFDINYKELLKIEFLTNTSPSKKALKFSVVLYHLKEDMYFHHFFTCFYRKSWWNYHSDVILSLCPLDANEIWSSEGHYHWANLCNKPVYNIFIITSKIILHNLSPWILNVPFRPNQIPFGYYFFGLFYSLSLSVVSAYCFLGCTPSTSWDRDGLLLRGFNLVHPNPEFPWLKFSRVTAKLPMNMPEWAKVSFSKETRLGQPQPILLKTLW